MIFQIDDKLLAHFKGAKLSDLVSAIMDGQHYIKCRPSIRKVIEEAVLANASTTQYERFQSYQGFDIPTQYHLYITTLNLSDFEDSQVEALVSRPSWLIVENELNEWPVYKHMMYQYRKDRKFGDFYEMLLQAADKTLIPHTTGGYGQFQQALISHDAEGQYQGTLRYKSCTLVDRDTDGPNLYDANKAKLYTFLSGKEFNELTDEDIYSLDQPHYIWHMWYKRAIENYFPVESYRAIGANIEKIPDTEEERDYLKYNDDIYQKKDLPRLTTSITRSKYEETLKKFPFNGEQISELQLFLLKLVKII